MMNKKIILFCGIFLFLFFFISPTYGDDQKAREIMDKVYERDDGDNIYSDMEMILIDKNKKKRIRKIKSFKKDKGEDILSIMFFHSPPDVKDTGFLTYDYDDRNKDDDQWLYLPALKKTKRIAGSDKKGSFMGSDFTYGDMTRRADEDYDYKILKEKEVAGAKTWFIEAIPRSEEIIKEFGYTKSILFVRQDNYVVVRAVHWVKKGKRLKYMDVKKLELIDNIWIATETHMITKDGKRTIHKTILKQSNIKFNENKGEGFFSVRQLEKGL